jgi:hypothetical protein
MSDQTPEPFDALESRLAQRMRAYSQHAIEPIDPAALAHAAVTPRRPAVRLALPAPIASWPRAGWAALLVALLALGLLGAMLATGAFRPAPFRLALAPSSSPFASALVTPSPSLSPSETPRSAFDGTLVAIERMGSAGLVSGVPYTSSAFTPKVALRLRGLGQRPNTGQETDWCSPREESDASTPRTSARAIVLAWRYACISDLRIIRPFAVDCGTPDTHPDAAALAAAILARPGIDNVHDRGTLQTPQAVPPGLFLGRYSGRVLEIIRSRDLDPKAIDPNGCRLLPEPGTGDPTIEVRGDMNATLILVDVGGELVVIRAGSAGYDGRTAAAGEARGYGSVDVLGAMLTGIYAIEFR